MLERGYVPDERLSGKNKSINKWRYVGDKILPFFEDPKYQGEYYIYEGDIPIEEIITQDPFRIEGIIPIASNFGSTTLGIAEGKTTYILKPDKKEGYILFQGKNRIVKITGEIGIRRYMDLNPNPLKLFDGGNMYLIDGGFGDVMEEINSAGYKFFEKEEGELWTNFYLRLKKLSR